MSDRIHRRDIWGLYVHHFSTMDDILLTIPCPLCRVGNGSGGLVVLSLSKEDKVLGNTASGSCTNPHKGDQYFKVSAFKSKTPNGFRDRLEIWGEIQES